MKYIYTALFFFCLVFFISTTASAAGSFAGGDGSPGNPFQIETCLQLQDAKDNLSSSFILNNDINCYDTINWNGGSGFVPIGNFAGGAFVGTFNGQYYAINDLYIGSTGDGLFGAASGTIQNLGLNNVRVNSPNNSYVGGMVGTLLGGSLTRVFATGEVSGVSYVGGLVGWHSSGLITDVYTRVTASGTYSGGIVGRNDASVISNAYAAATTSAGIQQKGLIGNNFGGTSVNSFYDGELSGLNDTNGASTPKTTAQMKSVNTYTATSTAGLTTPWDFVGNPNNDVGNANVWDINPLLNNGYPYFAAQVFDQTAPTITSISSTASDGTYKVGEGVPVTVTFSEPVTSTGSVTVTFETGITDRTCTFTINHSSVGTCSLVVQVGDFSNDLDTISVSGVMADRLGYVMTNFSPAAGLAAQKQIVIDGSIFSTGGWVGSSSGGGGGVDLFYLSKPTLKATGTPVRKPLFVNDLRYGDVGADVKLLQKYLNTHGYTVSKSGIGSAGLESNRFGSATRGTLIRLQKGNKLSATGYFDLQTRQYVNLN